VRESVCLPRRRIKTDRGFSMIGGVLSGGVYPSAHFPVRNRCSNGLQAVPRAPKHSRMPKGRSRGAACAPGGGLQPSISGPIPGVTWTPFCRTQQCPVRFPIIVLVARPLSLNALVAYPSQLRLGPAPSDGNDMLLHWGGLCRGAAGRRAAFLATGGLRGDRRLVAFRARSQALPGGHAGWG